MCHSCSQPTSPIYNDGSQLFENMNIAYTTPTRLGSSQLVSRLYADRRRSIQGFLVSGFMQLIEHVNFYMDMITHHDCDSPEGSLQLLSGRRGLVTLIAPTAAILTAQSRLVRTLAGLCSVVTIALASVLQSFKASVLPYFHLLDVDSMIHSRTIASNLRDLLRD